MKVIVIGDGLLGQEICKQTNWDFTSRKKTKTDITDLRNISSILTKYDVVVNCIANTDTYSDDMNSHWDLNYRFVSDLVDFCNTNELKLVHISTDYIYSNSVSKATEDDVPVHLGTWYGYTKLLGDAHVQLKSNNFLVCRLSHKQKPFPYENAWVDIKTNCDYVDVIANLVIKLINQQESGVFNVGTETKSIYDLALRTKNVNSINKPEHVPYDTSMSIDKMKKVILI